MMETSMESYWGDAECQGYVRAVVVKKHTATDDTQLSLTNNEIVIILEQDETGWWGGHKEGKEEKTGWFPGSCVRILTPPQDGKVASALDTVPSPARQSYKATSPEPRDAGHSRNSAHNYQELLSEYEHLKRDKAVLEERLQKLQTKSDEDQKILHKTTERLKGLEAQLRDSDAKLQGERRQRAALQEENARLKEEITQLKATATALSSVESHPSHKVKTEPSRDDRPKPEVRPPVSSVPSAVASASSMTEDGEAPPVGTVKQIREAFERRSMTPQRPERERPEYRSGSLGNLARDGALPPSIAGRFTGPVDRQADGNVDFGLSPIRRGSRPNPFFGDAKCVRAST